MHIQNRFDWRFHDIRIALFIIKFVADKPKKKEEEKNNNMNW